MKTHPVQEMYNYNVWANGLIINRLKELPKDIYHKDVQSGFSSVSKVLTHIYLVEQSWFDIIIGQTMSEALASASQVGKLVETKDIHEMDSLYNDLSQRNKSLLVSKEDMDHVIVVDNPYAGLLETSISESVLHVVTHGNYHRGNIATMLRQMGHTSVMQDYGLYLYSRERENK